MEIDYLKAFYSQEHDEQSLLKGIDSVLTIYRGLQAKVFPCYIEKHFAKRIFNNESAFSLLSKKRNVSFFEYSRKIKSKINPETISGKFFIVSNKEYENIYTVITLEDTSFFSRCLLSYFLKSYPRISLTFITHKSLEKLLMNFRDNNFLKSFKIVRATVKSRIRQNIISSVHWPTFSLEEAFEWVKEENGWFERLAIETKKETSPKFKFSISRDGIIKANNFFSAIYSDFIIPISKTVHENVTFFGKRARLENNGEIRPLCIDLGYSHFDTLDENKRFIEAMKKMKASSVSVIHGNPYIQLSVFDYFDGSSYDIWVFSEDKIIIVPQLKSSFQAVKRLINHIFDNYYEGRIREHIPGG